MSFESSQGHVLRWSESQHKIGESIGLGLRETTVRHGSLQVEIGEESCGNEVNIYNACCIHCRTLNDIFA